MSDRVFTWILIIIICNMQLGLFLYIGIVAVGKYHVTVWLLFELAQVVGAMQVLLWRTIR